MSIEIGQKLPEATLYEFMHEQTEGCAIGPNAVQVSQAVAGKTIVIFANSAHVLEKIVKQTPVKHIITTEIGDYLKFPKNHIVNFVIKNVGICHIISHRVGLWKCILTRKEF